MTQYMATRGNTFLRKGPNTSSPVLKMIPEGAVLTAHEDEKCGWVYGEYDGVLGYCKTQNMTVCETPQYDDDNIGAAVGTAFKNVKTALDELERIVKLL